MPFRARSLLPKRRSKDPIMGGSVGEVLPAGLASGSQGERIDANVERRNGSPSVNGAARRCVNELININSVSGRRKAAEYFSARRSRACTGQVLRTNSMLVPTLVDLAERDLTIPERGQIVTGPVNGLFRVAARVRRSPTFELDPSGFHYSGYPERRYVLGKVCRVANVNHQLTICQEPQATWVKTFNRNCRAFGPVSRNRHYRFLLKLITFFGLSQRDFRSALRLRDLWLRGSRAFRPNIINFICSYPDEFRNFIRELPRTTRKKNPPRRGRDG